MTEVTMDEHIARALARDEAELMAEMVLTPAQQLLQIPPAIVFLANIVANESSPASRREQENRFARLQIYFHAARKELRPEVPPLRLFKLSPSMISVTLPPVVPQAGEAGAPAAAPAASLSQPAAPELDRAMLAKRQEAAALAERQLLAELEAERKAAAARRKPRRKPASARAAAPPLSTAARHPSRSSAEERTEEEDIDEADEDVPAARAAQGPTLEELTAARPTLLSPDDFEPTEWVEVSHAKPSRGGTHARRREEAALAVSVTAKAAQPGAPQPRAEPNAGRARTPPVPPSGQAVRVPSSAAAAAAAPAASSGEATGAPPVRAPQPPAAHAQLALGVGAAHQQAPPPMPQAQAATPSPAHQPAAAVSSPSALELACDAVLCGSGSAACALDVARAVQAYATSLLAAERAAHEAALCRALKEAHERSEARAQSLRLRLYISESKCAELEQTVRELEQAAAGRTATADAAAASATPTANE